MKNYSSHTFSVYILTLWRGIEAKCLSTMNTKKFLCLFATAIMSIAVSGIFTSCGGDNNSRYSYTPQESGIYVGVIGFNEVVYATDDFSNVSTGETDCYNFIDALTVEKNTALYYAMREGINYFDNGNFPDDVTDVFIVTFTDGLDNVSGALAGADSKEEVKDDVVDLIANKLINGQNITSYTVGVKSDDLSASDEIKLQSELEELSSGDGYSFLANSFSELSSNFTEIASNLVQIKMVRTLTCIMPAEDKGTQVRWTFDDVSDAKNSTNYIEGEVYKEDGDYSLINLHYVGVNASNEVMVEGEQEGVASVKFTFNGFEICPNNEEVIKFHRYDSADNTWQIDSESGTGSIENESVEETSIAVMLVLDCSSSLGENFVTMKTSAQGFIDAMLEGYEIPEPATVDCDEINAIDRSFAFGAPKGLTGTYANGWVTLAWNDVYGASEYNIYRSNSASGTYYLMGNSSSTSYTDNVTLGNVYYYKVTATNDVSESDPSDVFMVFAGNL